VPAGDVVVAAYSGVINLVQARPVPSPSSAP